MNKLALLVAAGLFAVAIVFPTAVDHMPSYVQKNMMSVDNLQNEIPAWIIDNFRQWKQLHNKAYSSAEVEIYRMAVYYTNYLYIEAENARQSEYVLGENQFMDMTQEEWAAQHLSVFPENYEYPESQDDSEYVVVNGEVNWETEGKVGPVLNQGQCGSCWAFSATETVQSFFGIQSGTVPQLSEQQLVDCTTSYGNEGCNGGWPSYGLEYVKDNGQTTSSAYPYKGVDGTCKVQGGSYKISNVLTSSGCPTLVKNINTQPTSVCVDATNWSFYRSGVFSNCQKNINHAVLAIGYDASGNWIVRNSWGASWGTKGNIILKTGDTCAVCQVLANVE